MSGSGSRTHFRAKREHLERLAGLVPESQGQNLALTVPHVPCPPHRRHQSIKQQFGSGFRVSDLGFVVFRDMSCRSLANMSNSLEIREVHLGCGG